MPDRFILHCRIFSASSISFRFVHSRFPKGILMLAAPPSKDSLHESRIATFSRASPRASQSRTSLRQFGGHVLRERPCQQLLCSRGLNCGFSRCKIISETRARAASSSRTLQRLLSFLSLICTGIGRKKPCPLYRLIQLIVHCLQALLHASKASLRFASA